MKRSMLKSSHAKAQLLCAVVALFGLAMPAMAISTWFHEQYNFPVVPISNQWTCSFPQPNGADDWADFSPFSSQLLSLQENVYTFRWDNGYPRSSGNRVEVPTMARASGNGGFYDTGGMGNRAVIQTIYAVLLNRHAPSVNVDVSSGGSALLNDLVPAIYSDSIMTSVIRRVEDATGINDGGDGTIDQLAAGLQIGSGYYLSCAPGGRFGPLSSQIYTSSSFMGNIDIAGFTGLILDGTVMIVQTNKLIWNSSRRAWTYGDDGLYLIKAVTSRTQFSTSGTFHSYTYTLYDVATGTTKVVTPEHASIRNIWSTGSISSAHTVTMLDDGNPNYSETIIGFAGLDAFVNRY